MLGEGGLTCLGFVLGVGEGVVLGLFWEVGVVFGLLWGGGGFGLGGGVTGMIIKAEHQ